MRKAGVPLASNVCRCDDRLALRLRVPNASSQARSPGLLQQPNNPLDVVDASVPRAAARGLQRGP